jgi:F-type H+/Na+-transporting ATPase subunit alpha
MAGSLRLELAQFREVEDFTKLGFVLDDITKRLVDRGERLTQLLIQERFKPLSISDQTILLYAALNGFLDGIPVNMVSVYEFELFRFLRGTFIYEPLIHHLKDNLDSLLLDYVLGLFKEYFIKFFSALWSL